MSINKKVLVVANIVLIIMIMVSIITCNWYKNKEDITKAVDLKFEIEKIIKRINTLSITNNDTLKINDQKIIIIHNVDSIRQLRLKADGLAQLSKELSTNSKELEAIFTELVKTDNTLNQKVAEAYAKSIPKHSEYQNTSKQIAAKRDTLNQIVIENVKSYYIIDSLTNRKFGVKIRHAVFIHNHGAAKFSDKVNGIRIDYFVSGCVISPSRIYWVLIDSLGRDVPSAQQLSRQVFTYKGEPHITGTNSIVTKKGKITFEGDIKPPGESNRMLPGKYKVIVFNQKGDFLDEAETNQIIE